MRNCKGDGGRSSEVGLQVQASNHLTLLWSKATVVSGEEKAYRIRQVGNSETSASEPLLTHRNEKRMTSKPGLRLCRGKESSGCLLTGWVVSGVEVA